MAIAVIILAAGQGTRMNSARPKVLHQLAGKSLLSHVLLKAKEFSPRLTVIVHGHMGDHVKLSVSSELESLGVSDTSNLVWVEQKEQLGTGHAVTVAIEQSEAELVANKIDQILVLYGDVPLVDLKDINNLFETTDHEQLGLLTLKTANPYGLGRIIRDTENNVVNIVEEKDANSKQKLISEVNTGIFLLPYPKARNWLKSLDTHNTQNEYYLTDVIRKAVGDSVAINSVTVSDQESYRGINTLYQLAQAERHYQFLLALYLLEHGVKVIDPRRIDIRGRLDCEKDVYIDINCIFEGIVKLGKNCIIEPNCILKNVVLGDDVIVKANSYLEDVVVSNNCDIGPFARLRPGTVLADHVKIGNFVEVKKSTFAEGSKANHLSYIGDTTVGKNCNIGAGTITCNYDGVTKNKTIIGDGAFIGSNCSLIAPVTIGDNATIGAGSTVSKDAPGNKLTVSRSKQTIVEGWQRKDKTT